MPGYARQYLETHGFGAELVVFLPDDAMQTCKEVEGELTATTTVYNEARARVQQLQAMLETTTAQVTVPRKCKI